MENLPPTALLPDLRYDQLAIALGGKGRYVRTPQELEVAVSDGIAAIADGTVTVINVIMDSGSKKKYVIHLVSARDLLPTRCSNDLMFHTDWSLVGWLLQSPSRSCS